MTTTAFTIDDLAALGACEKAIYRVAALGGAAIPAAYLESCPDDWTDLVWLAWRLHRAGRIDCPDLVWSIARIAFRDLPPPINQYAATLGPENWRDAARAANANAAARAVTRAVRAADIGAADIDAAADAAADAADAAVAAVAANPFARAEIIALAMAALATA